MPADASPAAAGRTEPSGPADAAREAGGPVPSPADGVRRDTGATVPPPRSAPAVEADPAPDEGAVHAGGGARPLVEPADAGPAPAAERTEARQPAAERTEARQPAAEVRPTDDGSAAGDGLAERDRQILAFEQRWWRHAGAKEQAIRDTFGLSATRYYQLLNALLDHPAALAAEPVLVGRLRRLRSTRTRDRRR
ncbi:DUF3263 domain-containing protein [Micromonospora eburnea]|uniref:DUF3263 domain-containing protein n=1 Tax=Micromonospora eburnea TaxID=227316 RepID=A0A1C6VMN1_9ACTN|nr:DUF3263 domain-containing protein [Micromonospora eburnea]SCL67170.1 Protein of unknown function [Micromonospora eburnea]